MLTLMLLSLSVPPGHDRGPQYVQQVLTALHGRLLPRDLVHLEFGVLEQTAGLFIRLPDGLGPLIAHHLADAYPDATIQRLHEDRLAPGAGDEVWGCELWLAPDSLSLRTYRHFEDALSRTLADPLAGILSALRPQPHDPVSVRVILSLHPARARRCRHARRIVQRLDLAAAGRRRDFQLWYARLATHRSRGRRAWAALARPWLRTRPHATAAAPEFARLHGPLFETRLLLLATGPRASRPHARARLRALAAAWTPFASADVHLSVTRVGRYRPRMLRVFRRGCLLSPEEIATLWHPPTETVRVAAMTRTTCQELEPPAVLASPQSHPELAVLGRVRFRNRREVCGLLPDDRRRHLAVVGKTGMGKTTLLQSLLVADIAAGRGVGLIDPHGDMAESLLSRIPRQRTNDVVYFDAGDRDHPIAFNPLHCPDPQHRPLVASGIVSAFKRLYGDSWGPRLEYILRNAILTLLETPEASLAVLSRLLTDKAYRAHILTHVEDPVIRHFWLQEFQTWKPQLQAEAVLPVINKVGQFITHPILRAILSQTRGSLDLGHVLDHGKILIANLAKGRIGEDGSNLIGSLLVTGLQLAAMRRADQAESDRRDFYLSVDEFQNFATDSFATILSEARKYRLNLTIANQYLEQIPEATLAAVFGNVGSLLCFQVGARDAEMLAEQLGTGVKPEDLIALPKHTAYARLLVDGLPTRPFSLQTLPPQSLRGLDRADIVRRTSRHHHTRPAERPPAHV